MAEIEDPPARSGALGPEGALIAWLVGLPDGLDPARAAQIALAAAPGRGAESPQCRRFRALLAEVGRTPLGTLTAPARRRRNRRGPAA